MSLRRLLLVCVVLGVFVVHSSATNEAQFPWFQREILSAFNCSQPNEVAVDTAGYIYAACWNNGIMQLNPRNGNLVTVVSAPVCSNPYTIKYRDGMLYAGCWTADVIMIDPGTFRVTVLSDQTKCNSVVALNFNPVNGHLILGCKWQNANGIVLGIDPVTKTLTTLLDSPSCINPLSAVVDPITGNLYAACAGSGVVAVTPSGTITNVLSLAICDFPRFIAYNSFLHSIVVPCSQTTSQVPIVFIDTTTNLPNWYSYFQACSAGQVAVVNQNTGTSYIACSTSGGVVAIDSQFNINSVAPTGSLCSGISAVSFDSNSGYLYASCFGSSSGTTPSVLQLAPPC